MNKTSSFQDTSNADDNSHKILYLPLYFHTYIVYIDNPISNNVGHCSFSFYDSKSPSFDILIYRLT